MTIKETVVRESINRIRKRVNEIDGILNANPLIDIVHLERETITKAKKLSVKGNYAESLKLLKKAQKKKNKLLEIANKQQEGSDLISEKVKLEMELGSLNNELYHITMMKG